MIVDDHPVVLAGLTLLLTSDPRFTLCGEARTAAAACERALGMRPDLIVTDLVLGGDDGLPLIEHLLAIVPEALILVYSSQDEASWARRVLHAGARGYVSKAEPLDRVAVALDDIARGDIYLNPALPQPGTEASPSGRSREDDLRSLSPRELQVLTLIAGGHSLQSLGRLLGVSVKTVGTYRERIKSKLGLEDIRMLERYAAAHLADAAPPA